MSCMEQTCFLEATGREGIKGLAKVVCYMPGSGSVLHASWFWPCFATRLDEPQRLIWSWFVGLSTEDG